VAHNKSHNFELLPIFLRREILSGHAEKKQKNHTTIPGQYGAFSQAPARSVIGVIEDTLIPMSRLNDMLVDFVICLTINISMGVNYVEHSLLLC
jgi:hypothetical protein